VKAGLKPDSQRYFDYHHAANDKFDAINKVRTRGGHDGFFDVFDGSKRYCELVSKNAQIPIKKPQVLCLWFFHL
jgi:hypothetical protein